MSQLAFVFFYTFGDPAPLRYYWLEPSCHGGTVNGFPSAYPFSETDYSHLNSNPMLGYNHTPPLLSAEPPCIVLQILIQQVHRP